MSNGIREHFVRPDRVYATGVLSPIVGYQPTEDAQQVAMRFVSGGQGLGYAGPRGEIKLMGGMRGLGGARFDGFINWIRNLIARIRVRVDLARLRNAMKVLPPGASVPTNGKSEVDTSPRPAAPSPTSIPTESGWSPTPTSPSAVAASFNPAPQEPPTLPSMAASMQLAPQATNLPSMYWGSIIAPTLPPVVGARQSETSLSRFYRNLRGARR